MAIDNDEVDILNALEMFTSYPKDILKLVAEYSADEYIWIVDNITGDMIQDIYNYCPNDVSSKHRLTKHKILLDLNQPFNEKIKLGWIYKIPYENDYIYISGNVFNRSQLYISYDHQFLIKIKNNPSCFGFLPRMRIKLTPDHSL